MCYSSDEPGAKQSFLFSLINTYYIQVHECDNFFWYEMINEKQILNSELSIDKNWKKFEKKKKPLKCQLKKSFHQISYIKY